MISLSYKMRVYSTTIRVCVETDFETPWQGSAWVYNYSADCSSVGERVRVKMETYVYLCVCVCQQFA